MKNLILVFTLLFTFPCLSFAQKHLELLSENPAISTESLKEEMQDWYRNSSDPHKSRDMKKFYRWLMWNDGAKDHTGQRINSARKIWEADRKLNRSLASQGRSPNGTWTDATPDNWGINLNNVQGRVHCIAIHPVNSNIIYVGSALGGLWKSADGGSSWSQLTAGLPIIGVSSIVINPSDPNEMYIATGEADGRDIPSLGILRSTDAGLTWEETALQFELDDEYYCYKLIMHPTFPSIMLLATDKGIFRTTDSWETVENVPGTQNQLHLKDTIIYDLEWRPGSPQFVYACSKKTIYRSDDTGLSWSQLSGNTSGLPLITATRRISLAVTEQDPMAVFAVLAANGTGNGYLGLYSSQDGGDNWISKSDTLNIVGAGTYNQSHYNLAIEIDPSDTNTVYICGISVYKSTSAGDSGSWAYAGNGCHADVHAMLFRNGVLYVGSDGGLAKTANGGSIWTHLSEGLKIRQFYFLDVDDTRIIAGSQDNGTSLWYHGASSGQQVLGGDGLQPVFHPEDTNVVYASQQGGRYKSISGGAHDTYSNILPLEYSGDIWTAPWVLHPTYPDTMYMGVSEGRIVRSFNGGDINSWVVIDSGYGARVISIAQCLSAPDVAYATDRHVVRRTENLNAAVPIWEDVTSNLPDISQIVELVVDSHNPLRAWALYWGYDDANKVYRTVDGGTSWSDWSDGLPDVRYRAMVYKEGSFDEIYVGGELGVFYRNGTMIEWNYFSNGLPNTRINDLLIRGGFLYAATYGNGVWKSTLDSACPNSYSLLNAALPFTQPDVGTWVFEAQTSINTDLILEPNLGNDITLRAGSSVDIELGTHIKAGAQFAVQIRGCDN